MAVPHKDRQASYRQRMLAADEETYRTGQNAACVTSRAKRVATETPDEATWRKAESARRNRELRARKKAAKLVSLTKHINKIIYIEVI